MFPVFFLSTESVFTRDLVVIPEDGGPVDDEHVAIVGMFIQDGRNLYEVSIGLSRATRPALLWVGAVGSA